MKLTATRPNATREVEIEGVKFKIGILPRVIHLEYLDSMMEQASSVKLTDDELELIQRQQDGEKMTDEEMKKVTAAAAKVKISASKSSKAMERVVAFGVKGHDLAFEDGEPVKFKTVKENVDGKMLERVSDELLEMYYNLKLTPKLSGEVQKGVKVEPEGN